MKLILVAGARPNFMKIAPLIRAIGIHNGKHKGLGTTIRSLLVHTGQHYNLEMSKAFFRNLSLPDPDINLEVGSGSHAAQTAQILLRFETVCEQEAPDWVVVVGDVNSTMASTLVAAKMGIRVAHVEAGLRSFDRSMPEEINRLVTDALADLLFTPSEDADANLLCEGVPASKIKRVGNIMIDTLLLHINEARRRKPFEQFGLMPKEYAFVTLHRPSNVDDGASLACIMDCLERMSGLIPIVFAVHPRTRKNLLQHDLWKDRGKRRLILCNPLGYHDSIGIIDQARFVLTDSGGIQEETTFLRVPCLTLRPNTERPITITKGTNKLTSLGTLHEDIEVILLCGEVPQGGVPELWDGLTGERIIGSLIEHHCL